MKLRRVNSLLSATVLAVSSVLSLGFAPLAHAASGSDTCTWTGTTNTNFSTATNWSGCSSAAPVNGDNLVFDNTSLTAAATLNNDISGLSIGSITFSGTNSNFYGYTITGDAITISGGLTQSANSIATLNLDLTLGGDQAINLSGSNLILGDSTGTTTHTIAMAGHTLTVSGSDCTALPVWGALSGAGAIVDDGTSNVALNADSPSYTGTIAVESGTLYVGSSKALGGSTATTTVSSGAVLSLGFDTSTTYNEPIVLNGGTIATNMHTTYPRCAGGGGGSSSGTATLSGPVTLQANSTADPTDQHNLKLTGDLSGAYTLDVKSGATGVLIVAATSNTSKTANNTYAAEATTTTVASTDKQPTTDVDILNKQTWVIDGSRGATTVELGGILKGSGQVGDLSVFAGGIVAPGHSPGCMKTGDLVIDGTYQAEIGGTTACSGYDQLQVTGLVTLQNSNSLDVSLYNNFKPAVGQKYEIISNDGTDKVSGTFSGLAEGATFKVSNYVFKISYKGGDGNDVVLTVVPAPKTPDTGVALAATHPGVTLGATVLAAGAIFGLARRTRKVSGRR